MRTKVLTECTLDAMDAVPPIFPVGVSNAALLHTAMVHGNYSIVRDEDIESIDERLSGFQNAMRSSSTGHEGRSRIALSVPCEFTCVVGKLSVRSTLIHAMIHKICFGSLKDFPLHHHQHQDPFSSRFLGATCVDACDMLLQPRQPCGEGSGEGCSAAVDLGTIRDEPLATTEERFRDLVRACCTGISERISTDEADLSPPPPSHHRLAVSKWALSVVDWAERCYTNFASLEGLFRAEMFPEMHPRNNDDMWRNIAAVVEMRIVKMHEWRASTMQKEETMVNHDQQHNNSEILQQAWDFLISLLVDSMNRQLWALLPVASFVGTAFIRRHVVAIANHRDGDARSRLASDLRHLARLSSPELLGALSDDATSRWLRCHRRSFVALGNVFVMHGLLEALGASSDDEERANREVLARVCPLDAKNGAISMLRSMMQGAARTIVGIRRCTALIEEFASQDAPAAAQGRAHGYEGTIECASKSALVEYAVRRLNAAVYGVNKDLAERARNDLHLMVGHDRATRLIGALQDFTSTEDEREYRGVLHSIALLWAAWTAAVATPGTWLPAETLLHAFGVEQGGGEEQDGCEKASGPPPALLSSSTAAPWYNHHYEQRRAKLGTRACMLVTTLAAYACLPGRPLPGASYLEEGARESLHLMESDASSRVRRAIVTEQQQPPITTAATPPFISAGQLLHQQQQHRRRRPSTSLQQQEDEEEDQRAPEDDGEEASLSSSEDEADDDDDANNNHNTSMPHVYPPVAPYYKTRHFQRIGTHTSVAWDDCMWMMLMQEEALALPDDRDGDRETRFVEYEREFVMLKPFLLFGAVFASGMARTGVLYNDEANAEFLRSVVQQRAPAQEEQGAAADKKEEEEEEDKAPTFAPPPLHSSRRRTRRRI